VTAPAERPIDAVLLDFGGVFTDSPFEAVRAMGADMGAPIDEVIDIVFGSYDDDTDHVWHRCERGELDLASCRRAITESGRERGLDIDLFEMLKYMASDGGPRTSVIDRTRQLRLDGYRTALVTNNIVEFREFWRPMLPLDELFDVVVDSSEVGVRKPDPRIFALALDQLGGIDATRSVFLDDYPGNVEAARRVGMYGIVVETDPTGALVELDRLLDGDGDGIGESDVVRAR
jgi:epoxide hydrolase-like predicted phosphatase